FYKMNDFYLYSDSYYQNSLLFRNKRARSERDRVHLICLQTFSNTHHPLLFETLAETTNQNDLVKYYSEIGFAGLIVCPLKCEDGDLVGVLEIATRAAGKLTYQHVMKIQSAMQFFSRALENTNETLELQMDKIIKEHFTAIQSAVEWKFTEAAFHYLQNKQQLNAAKMPAITFEDVFPLYGAIDVR